MKVLDTKVVELVDILNVSPRGKSRNDHRCRSFVDRGHLGVHGMRPCVIIMHASSPCVIIMVSI